MKERPILFSAPMVRAILDGTKTQTRRVLQSQPADMPTAGRFSLNRAMTKPVFAAVWNEPNAAGDTMCMCPYGDRLWVREAWRVDASLDRFNGTQIGDRALDAGYPKPWAPIQYEADGARYNWVHKFGGVDTAPGRLRHARFMPRWASRITLEVTGVRVERLQDISEADAQAEGCPCYVCGRTMDGLSENDCHCFHRQAGASDYRTVWESINGVGSWDANPWVWVVSFRRVTP